MSTYTVIRLKTKGQVEWLLFETTTDLKRVDPPRPKDLGIFEMPNPRKIWSGRCPTLTRTGSENKLGTETETPRKRPEVSYFGMSQYVYDKIYHDLRIQFFEQQIWRTFDRPSS